MPVDIVKGKKNAEDDVKKKNINLTVKQTNHKGKKYNILRKKYISERFWYFY